MLPAKSGAQVTKDYKRSIMNHARALKLNELLMCYKQICLFYGFNPEDTEGHVDLFHSTKYVTFHRIIFIALTFVRICYSGTCSPNNVSSSTTDHMLIPVHKIRCASLALI